MTSVSQKWMRAQQKQKYRALHAEEIAEQKAAARVKRIEVLQEEAPWKLYWQNFYKAVWRMVHNPLTQWRVGPLPGRNPELHGALDYEMLDDIREWL